jgi:hypothetical protein
LTALLALVIALLALVIALLALVILLLALGIALLALSILLLGLGIALLALSILLLGLGIALRCLLLQQQSAPDAVIRRVDKECLAPALPCRLGGCGDAATNCSIASAGLGGAKYS